MPVVPENERVATLREWGVSEPLIQLSCGESVHEQFDDHCKGPPWYVYRGSVPTPAGPPLAVLWEWSERVTGVRRRRSGLEYIRYGLGRPEEYELLARSEQGFWAAQFDFLYECEAEPDELREAAAAVGFRFLDRYLASREAAEEDVLGTFEGHRAWLRKLVAGIDRESRGQAQKGKRGRDPN